MIIVSQKEVLKLWQSRKNEIKWFAINFKRSPRRGNLINWRGTE